MASGVCTLFHHTGTHMHRQFVSALWFVSPTLARPANLNGCHSVPAVLSLCGLKNRAVQLFLLWSRLNFYLDLL